MLVRLLLLTARSSDPSSLAATALATAARLRASAARPHTLRAIASSPTTTTAASVPTQQARHHQQHKEQQQPQQRVVVVAIPAEHMAADSTMSASERARLVQQQQQQQQKEAATGSLRASVRKAALILGGIVATPAVAALGTVWWMLGEPLALAVVDIGITLGCWLGAAPASVAGSSAFFAAERALDFDRTLLDVAIFVSLRFVVVAATVALRRWRSRQRQLLAGISALAATSLLVPKLCLFDIAAASQWAGSASLAHAVMVAPLVLAWAGVVSEFWIATSRAHLDRSERLLLTSLPSQMHKRRAAGMAYLVGGPEFPPAQDAVNAGDDVNSGRKSPPPSSGDDHDHRNHHHHHHHHHHSHDPKNSNSKVPSMVLLHGYGASKGFFIRNFADLTKHHRVFSLDWPGVGESRRPRFAPRDRAETEKWFVDSLEAWRVAVGLDHFDVLLGHSFGGYMAGCYALAHPDRVKQLILASPVGLPVPPTLPDGSRPRRWRSPLLWWLIHRLWQVDITPQSIVRFLGPAGPWLVRKVVGFRLGHVTDMDMRLLAEYAYHANAGPASSERMLNRILLPGAWPREPLAPRLRALTCPTLLAYGLHDWMDSAAGADLALELSRRGVRAKCVTVGDAGHQLFIENPTEFDAAVLKFVAEGPSSARETAT